VVPYSGFTQVEPVHIRAISYVNGSIHYGMGKEVGEPFSAFENPLVRLDQGHGYTE
jgi:hypothetical protein